MPLRNQIQLICYPNRIGDNLSDLYNVLEKHFSDAIGGVHILPFYPSNADAGFSPLTHKEVEPAYGTWDDIERISAKYDLCCDVVLNHISDASPEFKDFVKHGSSSQYADLFIDIAQMGPITPDDLSKIHIRKNSLPFRDVTHADGSTGQVWCTFTTNQIDLNFDSPKTLALIEDYIVFLANKGVKLFRLDAFGYVTKRIGTSCFLVEPDVYEVLDWANAIARKHGAECMPEVHDHPSYQYAIADHGLRPYGFMLPPLVLYSLLEVNSTYLKQWLRMCPKNMITVLDTHDGIGIPDVEGALPDDKIEDLVQIILPHSGPPSLQKYATSIHGNGTVYQLNCTFYDALMQNDDAYIAARAIQFFTPGIPQVYYVGLFAGENDWNLMKETDESREINRQYYNLDEVEDALEKPVVQRLLILMRLRNSHPAFDGEFKLNYSNDSSVDITWKNGHDYCRLFVELNFKTTTVTYNNIETGEEITLHA